MSGFILDTGDFHYDEINKVIVMIIVEVTV